MRLRISLIGFLSVLLISSCIKPPEYSEIPFLKFVSVNKIGFTESAGDSLVVTLYFEDGDGDLGGAETDSMNMFWEDSRVPGFYLPFKIPFIELQGNHDDISGNVYVTFDVACINPVPVDTFHFNIYIEDRAGNKSNIVKTSDITVGCN